ncbi:hypothetical protein NQ315_001974, partial [Exocentrus adspersus]
IEILGTRYYSLKAIYVIEVKDILNHSKNCLKSEEDYGTLLGKAPDNDTRISSVDQNEHRFTARKAITKRSYIFTETMSLPDKFRSVKNCKNFHIIFRRKLGFEQRKPSGIFFVAVFITQSFIVSTARQKVIREIFHFFLQVHPSFSQFRTLQTFWHLGFDNTLSMSISTPNARRFKIMCLGHKKKKK